jgi:hypothetical protein
VSWTGGRESWVEAARADAATQKSRGLARRRLTRELPLLESFSKNLTSSILDITDRIHGLWSAISRGNVLCMGFITISLTSTSEVNNVQRARSHGRTAKAPGRRRQQASPYRCRIRTPSLPFIPIISECRRHYSGIMGDIARNRHTEGFAHILVDSLPVASRIPSPTCTRKYPGTHELARLGSLLILGLGLALRGLLKHTGICWCPSIPNHSL